MQYVLIDKSGASIEEGSCHVEISSGSIKVIPDSSQPIIIKGAEVEIEEPSEVTLRLKLDGDYCIDLSMMAQMRGQILRELKGAKQSSYKSAKLLVGIGKPEKFKGNLNEVQSEIFLYDDALVVVGETGQPIQFLYSFVESISADPSGYRISIDVQGMGTHEFSKLANFTESFRKLLTDKIAKSKVRTGAFLSAVLPGLNAMTQRSVASKLKDGLATSASELDQFDNTLSSHLFDISVNDRIKDDIDFLKSSFETYIGFKQVVSVQKAGRGSGKWYDHTHQPITDHGGAAGMGQGFQGALGASMMGGMNSMMGGMGSMGQGGNSMGGGFGFDAPFGERGSFLAFEMLNMMPRTSGMTSGLTNQTSHEVKERSVFEAGNITVASTNYGNLKVTGNRPTILAFSIFLTTTGYLIYDALNDADMPSAIFKTNDVTRWDFAASLIDFRMEALEGVDDIGSEYKNAIEEFEYLKLL